MADQKLDDLDARLKVAEGQRAALTYDLPALIEEAQRIAPSGRLGRAIAEPVADALGEAVSRRRQSIVDALFPIIMPAIRRAIAESLRVLSTDINRLLESSLTPRGIGWRIQSWRTGVPYAQIALNSSLRYRVDHLLLIQRDTGLVLDRESATDLAPLDGDAIAGMLTAIGDFVRDSVAAQGAEALTSATVGEHLLWVIEGPRAKLAAFIRGVPPESLKTQLQARLEALHARFGDQLALDPEHLAGLPEIKDALTPDDLRSSDAPMAGEGTSPLRTLWLIAAIAVVALLTLAMLHWRWQLRVDSAEARLREWPGFVLTDIKSRHWRSVDIEGLLDPIAQSPLPWLREQAFAGFSVSLHTRGYLATDAPIAAARLRSLLDAPKSVQIDVSDGGARLSGSVSVFWRDRMRPGLAAFAGLDRVDVSALQADLADSVREHIGLPDSVRIERTRAGWLLAGNADAGWRARFDALADRYPEFSPIDDREFVVDETHAIERINQRLLQVPVRFTSGAAIAEVSQSTLVEYAELLEQARNVAQALDKRLIVDVYGLNDAPGSDAENADIRRRRAQFLVERLRTQSTAAIAFVIHPESTPLVATIRIRAVVAQLRLE